MPVSCNIRRLNENESSLKHKKETNTEQEAPRSIIGRRAKRGKSGLS